MGKRNRIPLHDIIKYEYRNGRHIFITTRGTKVVKDSRPFKPHYNNKKKKQRYTGP